MSKLQQKLPEGDIIRNMSIDRRLSNWLWRPRYAKIWWTAIPLYWLAIGDPTRPVFLDLYADSKFAGYIHPLFTPVVALVVLGSGYVREAAAEGRIGPYETPRRRLNETHPDSPYSVHRRHEQFFHDHKH